jgi:thiamine biosynthesis lipoprotein ApbE
MKIKLPVLAIFAALIIITMLSSCGSSKAFNYEKYAAEREYPAWLKRHTPIFGWGDARKDRAEAHLAQSKAALKKQEAAEKAQSQIDELNQKAEAINAKLKSNK